MDHPVVHVSLSDARAFADWAELRLPCEKEWEYAAHGGDDSLYPWGDSLVQGGEIRANTWHGAFPSENRLRGAGPFTMPVNAFGQMGYGTRNMIGNVWEWTSTALDQPTKSVCCTPARDISHGELMVVKGGSHLCAESYCQRYRRTARSFQAPRSSTSHIGFRCAIDAPI